MSYSYSSHFINQPRYSVGDVVFSGGDDISLSWGTGQNYYSYGYVQGLDRDYPSHSEHYQYGESDYDQIQAFSYLVESFYYYLDENLSTVDQVLHVQAQYTYDNVGRPVADTQLGTTIHGDDDFDHFYKTDTFYYINSTSNRIRQHFREESKESENSDTLTTTSYTYDYSGMTEDEINSVSDFTTRWGVGTKIYNSESSTDEATTIYSKTTTRNNQNNPNSSSDTLVEINDQGIITYTDSYSFTSSNCSNGSSGCTVSYSSKWASDYDGDGIVNTTYEHTTKIKTNQSSWTELSKNDYDGDGYADYISMSRSSDSARGQMTTEYRYDTSSSFNRPILEIIRSLDTDMDGTADLIDERTVFRTLNARHTRMGGHVATLDDVLA